MNPEAKKELRQFIVRKRDEVAPALRQEWDNIIFDRLIDSEYYKRAEMIFTFVSFKSEVDTHRIIKRALEDKKIVCIPKIKSKEKGIELYRINGMDELKPGYFGILEPVESCPAVEAAAFDLILMPGVAFDRKGGRLGYGRGYYDRFLSKLDSESDKIALAYHFQLLDSVPVDIWDVLVDGIITEEEFISIKKL
ncbi:MAG: 5-formyltetrahydrofolate cyclo-ligase [Bacillota bacterium]|nr:5-formyltetrahydrofolate cyclo-ligase [Bacillota bacterium]